MINLYTTVHELHRSALSNVLYVYDVCTCSYMGYVHVMYDINVYKFGVYLCYVFVCRMHVHYIYVCLCVKILMVYVESLGLVIYVCVCVSVCFCV